MTNQKRRTVANISLSLDGRINGAGGDYDMSWIVPHVTTDTARSYMTRMTTATTTVLLGRKNYEGFSGYWPPVAHDETAEPRDRVFARWLNDVDKIVFSNTLEHAPWQNSRISNDPITEVRKLRNEPGGDIAVLSSTSIIQTLLTADELDRLIITLCPTIVGRGAPFFDDDVPETTWTLTETATSPTGATTLVYERDS